MNTRLIVRIVAVASLIALEGQPFGAAGGERWAVTWGTAAVVRPAPSATSAAAAPVSAAPAPRPVTINNQTLRQIVHVSVGGSRVRVVFSNQFGTAPLPIGAASIGLSGGEAALAGGSAKPLLFAGGAGATIPPGAVLVSDAVDLAVSPAADLAIDLFVPADLSAAPVTAHGAAFQRNYLSTNGNFAGKGDFPVDSPMTSWFLLSRVEVLAPADTRTIVMFGDSITDGTASTINTNHRWPDLLAARLRGAKSASPFAIVNAAIAGNRLLSESTPNFGVNALARFDRDVLAQPGVTHVVVMEGINDIGNSPAAGTPTADEVIAAQTQLIERAHARSLAIVGATLTPIGGARYFSDEHEAKRQAVNTWIRTAKAYDAVIDFDAAVRDPEQPVRMLPRFDSGDHLHPSDAGYEAMANAVDLKVFASTRSR